MGGEVVEDDDVAPVQGWGKLGLDIGIEESPVHWPIDNPGRSEPEAAQARNECPGPPSAEGGGRLQPCSPEAAAAKTAHLRVGGGFVNKNKPVGLKLHPWKARDPSPARLFHIRAFLLRRHQRFFYK